MYNATESSRRRISFRQINRDTGNPVKQSLVDAETGDQVPREDIVKSYEYEKGKFVQIEPEEMDELKLESSMTIDIDQFVADEEIDELYVEAPYYPLPDGPVGRGELWPDPRRHARGGGDRHRPAGDERA